MRAPTPLKPKHILYYTHLGYAPQALRDLPTQIVPWVDEVPCNVLRGLIPLRDSLITLGAVYSTLLSMCCGGLVFTSLGGLYELHLHLGVANSKL